MSGRSKEILYWLEGSSPPEELIEPLEDSGYEILSFESANEILAHCDASPPTMIIVDAAAAERTAATRLKEIIDTPALHLHPLVIIAENAEVKTDPLKARVPNLLAIDFPYEFRAALEQVFSFVWLADSADPLAKLSRESLERQHDPLRLVGSYGGSVFGGGSSLESFHDDLLYPPHPKQSELMGLVVQLTGRDEWMGLHARRTAFVAAAIASGLGLTEDQANNIRTSALLLSCGIQEKMAKENRFDLSVNFSEDTLVKISSSLLHSASTATEKLQDEQALNTIQNMNALIKGSNEVKDEFVDDAKCVCMVELADRACWSRGWWEPIGAHRAMRLFDNQLPHLTNKLLMNSLMRVLVESLYLLDDMTPQRYRELHPQEDGDRNSTIIEISDLTPGMKTIQPVVTRAGTQVLAKGIRLKHDIIERIWRLAMVTPLRSPLIEVEFGEPGEDH